MCETETAINLLVNDILQTSKNEDIFDALSVILHQDNWHNFKSRLLKCNSSEKLRQFFKELFLKCLSQSSLPESVIFQWSQEMSDIFFLRDIAKIDLAKNYQGAEELIMDEKYENAAKTYGKIIWALINLVRFSMFSTHFICINVYIFEAALAQAS